MLAHEAVKVPGLSSALQNRAAGIAAIAAIIVAISIFPTPYDYALPLFAFFFLVVTSENSLFNLLGSAGVRVLGDCSYGAYLLHRIILYIAFTAINPAQFPMLYLPILAILVVLLTAGTYLAVEAPLIEKGRKIARLFPRDQRLPKQVTVAP